MRYYYKDNNNNYYSFKSEHTDLIPITEQEFNEHNSPQELSQEQIDLLVAKENAQREINECKEELSHLDIKRYKWLEGEISDNDFNTLYLPRIRELRVRINELEEQLGQSN